MKQGMILSLILALGLLGGTCLAAAPQPWDPQQQGDDTWGFNTKGAYLGVRTQDVTKERLSALKLKDETGVEVVMVDQDAPAAKAGIKEHDVLLTFNGTHIDSEEQLRRVVRETPPGRTVAVGLMRDGQPLNVNITLANRKEIATSHKILAMPPVPSHPNVPMMGMLDFDAPQVNVLVQTSGRSGIMVEGITPQLAEFFGCKNGASGVLVRAVDKGSAGEAAGLRAGDIILAVDKEKISDPGDWRHALRNLNGKVSLSILRDKKELNLNLNLPERKRGELELPNLDFSPEEIENSVKIELKDLRPIVDKNREQITILAKQLNATDGDISKEIQRAQEEARKTMENLKIDLNCDFSPEY
jgi:hypothetical protein